MYRVTLWFEDGTFYSSLQGMEGYGDVPEGTWRAPFPNTREDSFVFGFLESEAQSESPIAAVMSCHGEPDMVTISKM